MAQGVCDTAGSVGDVESATLAASTGLANRSRRMNWRGLFAMGFFFVSMAASYGFVFLLLDKWYKGGSLGIL